MDDGKNAYKNITEQTRQNKAKRKMKEKEAGQCQGGPQKTTCPRVETSGGDQKLIFVIIP